VCRLKVCFRSSRQYSELLQECDLDYRLVHLRLRDCDCDRHKHRGCHYTCDSSYQYCQTGNQTFQYSRCLSSCNNLCIGRFFL